MHYVNNRDMKKCCFIIPYFGTLPNYFPLFLKSCRYNPDFNWLLITNDETPYDYPCNFRKISMSFSELQSLVQSKFDFPISLDRPYKLCDYKPAYGYIFENYLKDYKCWGHCDVDTIMGKISDFVTEEMLRTYDKLFCLGHFIIYKNTRENCRLFMSKYNGEYLYKKVFSSPNILVFDEELLNCNNINQIFLQKGKKVFQEDYSLNFSIFYKNFLRVKFCGVENGYRNAYLVETPRTSICVWSDGKICRYLKEGDNLICEEYMYMHLQQRRMYYSKRVINAKYIHIIPNAFRSLKKLPNNLFDLQKTKKSTICFHESRLKINGYRKRFKRKMNKILKSFSK